MKHKEKSKMEAKPRPGYQEDDIGYSDTGRDYENDKSEDTGIPGFGVEGEPDDKTVDDDTLED